MVETQITDRATIIANRRQTVVKMARHIAWTALSDAERNAYMDQAREELKARRAKRLASST